MIKINVLLNNSAWKNYLKNPNIYLEKKLKIFNLKNKMYKKKLFFCTLLLSGDLEIKKLNKKFRKKNRSTDVLSFPFYNKNDLKKKLNNDKEIYLGDIIINLNKIRYKNLKKNFKIEFDRLWIHGFVHLFGYEHKKEKDYKKMRLIEKEYFELVND